MAWYPDEKDDYRNEVLQYVKNNNKGNRIVYIEYSYKQIGLTDEWLHDMYSKIGNPTTVKREILLQRLHGSSLSPFSMEDTEYIISVMQQPIAHMLLQDNFMLDLYVENLNKMTPYIVGIDCSTGTNGDNNAITIINPYTCKPEAEFACSYIGETLFEKLIMELVIDHIPRAIVVIERNSVGDALIDFFLTSPIAKNLYYDKDKDLVAKSIGLDSSTESMLKIKAEEKKYYGVYTSGNSRESMMSILMRRMAEYKDDFVTVNVTTDITRLVQKSSGKIEAGDGFHDDSIMSYLIGMYVWYHGNNLPRFGFIKGSQEIANQNQGLLRPSINIDAILPPEEVIAMRNKEEAKSELANELNYDEVLRKAIMESQRREIELHNKKLVYNSVLDNTSGDVLMNSSYNDDSLPLDLFDELNGF